MSLTPEDRLRLHVVEGPDATESHVYDAEGGQQGGARLGNVLNTIKAYWHDGGWVFDDSQRGLWAKPFVARAPEIIDRVLQGAGLRPRQPFTVTFGDHESPGLGYRFVLEWAREDREGHWYRSGGMEGLCPALVRYFDAAPKHIYCQVTARRTPFSVLHAAQVEGLWGARSRPTLSRSTRTRSSPRGIL